MYSLLQLLRDCIYTATGLASGQQESHGTMETSLVMFLSFRELLCGANDCQRVQMFTTLRLQTFYFEDNRVQHDALSLLLVP